MNASVISSPSISLSSWCPSKENSTYFYYCQSRSLFACEKKVKLFFDIFISYYFLSPCFKVLYTMFIHLPLFFISHNFYIFSFCHLQTFVSYQLLIHFSLLSISDHYHERVDKKKVRFHFLPPKCCSLSLSYLLKSLIFTVQPTRLVSNREISILKISHLITVMRQIRRSKKRTHGDAFY